MRYLALFDLEIIHSYYADKSCPDFEVKPTPETQRLLDAYRCVVKYLSHGLRVLIPVNENGLPIYRFPEEAVFAFHLRLRNPYFELFTDMTDISKCEAPLFTSQGPAIDGELVLINEKSQSSEVLTVHQPASREAFCLAGRILKDLKPSDFIVKGLGEKTKVKNYDKDSKIVKLDTSAALKGTRFKIDYPAPPQLAPGVFAAIKINYNFKPYDLSKISSQFQVLFRPKQARWIYYIITDTKTEPPSIEDKDNDLAFNMTEQVILSQDADHSDPLFLELSEKFPGKQCYRFTSNNLVSCRETPRKKLQLKFGNEKFMDALPNPSFHHHRKDKGNPANEYTMYQIITFLTH